MGQEEICTIFARNLNYMLERESMKQSDLVARLNVSKAQVSDWCAGKNIPRSNYLASLVELFGCQLSDLMSEKEAAPIAGSGLPEGYVQLTPENRAIVDRLIADLAKTQSKT